MRSGLFPFKVHVVVTSELPDTKPTSHGICTPLTNPNRNERSARDLHSIASLVTMVSFEPLPEKDGRLFHPPPSSATVLIVGSGPVGLVTALLLAQHNIKTAIVEKYPKRLGQPKAHALSPRTLEIFRQAKLDTDALRLQGTPYEDARWVQFITRVKGLNLGRLPYERQGEEAKGITPEPLFNISQPIVESFLEDAVLKTGLTTIHRSWEWQDVQLDEDKLQSRLRHRDTGAEQEIISEYLIGSDGTDSVVRKKLPSIQWSGLPGHPAERVHFVSIHCRADLSSIKGTSGPGELYFSLHPRQEATLIIYDFSSSWVYCRAVNPATEPVESFTREKCQSIIEECLQLNIDYQVAGVNIWFMDPRIASEYHAVDHRVFLAGDSAHSFPPAGGLGLNTGVADAHNLCWKLAHAMRNREQDPKALLSTYTTERRPVAAANALQSFKNAKLMWWSQAEIYKSLGPEPAAVPDEEIERIYQDPTVAQNIKRIIALNAMHFDSIGLQLGYVYEDGTGSTVEDCTVYEPSGRPGARLPHAWLGDGRSTLDLLSYLTFTLLWTKHNPTDGAATWHREAEHVICGGKVKVHVDHVDLSTVQAPPAWLKLLWDHPEGENNSALLIRPDQHIAGKVTCREDLLRLLERAVYVDG